jgi:hypothetical protein
MASQKKIARPILKWGRNRQKGPIHEVFDDDDDDVNGVPCFPLEGNPALFCVNKPDRQKARGSFNRYSAITSSKR